MSISGQKRAPERLNCLPHQVVHLLGSGPGVLESKSPKPLLERAGGSEGSDFHVKSPFGLGNVKNKLSPASDFPLIVTIVCLNKEVARASLSSSQSSSQSPDWRDTDVNEQGGQAKVPLGIEKLPQDCWAPLCSAGSPTWLTGDRPGSYLCISPSAT